MYNDYLSVQTVDNGQSPCQPCQSSLTRPKKAQPHDNLAYFLHVWHTFCMFLPPHATFIPISSPHTGISWHKYCNICKKCAKRQARILHFFIWGAFVGTDVANNTNPTQPKPANINKNKHIPTHPPLFFCRPPCQNFFLLLLKNYLQYFRILTTCCLRV